MANSPTSVSTGARRRRSAAALACLLTTPGIAVATTAAMVGAVAVAAPASAATAVAVTGLTATMLSPAQDSSITPSDQVAIKWDFNVPSTAQAGDTTTFTVPTYFTGAVNNLSVRDGAGNVIGTVSGAGQSFTITYSDYVTTHVNVAGSISLSLSPIYNRWPSGNGASNPVSVTNNGTTATAGNVVLTWSTSTVFGESSSLGQNNFTPHYDFSYFYSTSQWLPTDVGVKQTQTFTINPDSQGNAAFNCTAVQGTYGVKYQEGPDKANSTPYYASSSSDPAQMEVTSCSATQVTITYVPDVAGNGFTMTLVGSTVNGDAILVSDAAVTAQTTSPYRVTTVRTPAGGTAVTTTASASYNWNAGSGSGSQFPSATVKAYINDANPAAPTGRTADGQDSDANSAPGVSLLPGTYKASVVVKNTSVLTLTGGTVKNAAGQTVASVPSIASGASAVVQFDVPIGAGQNFSDTYTVTMSSASAGNAAPVSDPVNAAGLNVTPKATNDSATTAYKQPVTIDVLANDQAGNSAYPLSVNTLTLLDASGNAVSSLKVTGGTYTVSNGKIGFTPDALFVGTAGSATYQISDTLGNKATASVGVTVNNVKPVANPDSAVTPINKNVTIDVLANDVPGSADAPFDPTTLKLVDANGNAVNSIKTSAGTYTVSNGKIVFYPACDFEGNAPAVKYQVKDVLGNTVSTTVQVAVKCITTPTARPDSGSTVLWMPVSIDVLRNDTSGGTGDGFNTSTLTLIDSSGQKVNSIKVSSGTYAVSNGRITFTPNMWFLGTAPAVKYQVTTSTSQVTVGSTVQICLF